MTATRVLLLATIVSLFEFISLFTGLWGLTFPVALLALLLMLLYVRSTGRKRLSSQEIPLVALVLVIQIAVLSSSLIDLLNHLVH